MSKDNVVSMVRPEAEPQDVLTEIARDGACQMLTAALSAEVESFLAGYAGLVDEKGRQRVVRNGFLPEREVQTGIGAIAARAGAASKRPRSERRR